MATLTLPSFSLKGIQSDMFGDDRRFVAAVAGRNGGKTTGACHRIIGMIKRGELKDGARILVIAPDYTQMKDGTLKSFDRWFGDFPGSEYEPPGVDIIGRKVDGNVPMRWLRTGQEVMFRSGMNPEQTRSKECQLVWLDEAAQLSEQVFTLTNANLRQFGAHALYQTLITTTPRGLNWIYRRFGEQVNAAKRANALIAEGDDPGPDTEELIGGHHITTLEAEALGIVRPGYVDELGYEEGSQMWQQEVMAEFVAWTGRVFSDPPVVYHLPAFKWVYAGVDYGMVEPSAIECVGMTEAGQVYVFGEKYGRRMEVHEIVAAAGEKHTEHKVRHWYVDNDLLWKMMRNGGMPAKPPNKTKDAAGLAVGYINSLIARGMFFVHESCPNLIHEMQTYEYKEVQSGDEVTFLDKVKPNQFDHAIDALRYAIIPLSRASAAEGRSGWGAVSFGGSRG